MEQISRKKYEKHMIERFGTEYVMGGIHTYLSIEADTLYEKYGIHCINNPMSLNQDLYID